jgi:hypothetical protein
VSTIGHSFLVKLNLNKDEVTTFNVSFTGSFDGNEKNDKKKDEDIEPESKSPFNIVMEDFSKNMEMYLQFIPLMLSANGIASKTMMSSRIKKFSARFGKRREDISTEYSVIYELPIVKLREFHLETEEYRAWTSASVHIPQVMIIGLVSVYDHFLSELLIALFRIKKEIIFGAERQISFSDLLKYASIDDAREAIINKEVESIVRESHHEQFRILETRLGLKLTVGLTVWPQFIELCERRNLFTHTGGIVSQQYLSVCANYDCNLEGTSLGSRLRAQPKYLRSAIRIVYEIGLKLAYVMWRKLDERSVEKADSHINHVSFNLIVRKEYALAESILRFVSSVTEKTGSDHNHKLCIINLANTIRLQDREAEALTVLDREDWTASEDKFKICVAAIRKDFKEILRLIRRVGPSGSVSASDYQQWPVFIGIRDDSRVRKVLQEVFGENTVADEIEQKIDTDLKEINGLDKDLLENVKLQ